MTIIRGFEIIWSGIKTIDRCTLGIGEATKDVLESKVANNNIGCVHYSVETLKKSTDGTKYVATSVQKTGVYSEALFGKIDPDVIRFLQGASMAQIMGGIGLVSSTLGLICSFIAIYEQEKTLGYLYDTPDSHAREKEKEALINILQELQNLNYHQFLKSLPDYLKAKLEMKSKDGESIFESLITDIKNDQPANAYNLLQEIRTGVLKKEIFHLVTLISCVLGIAASIALILGCPMVGLTILSVVGIAFAITAFLMKKGWVENPKEGFNWKLCLPQFLQKKLKIDKDIETELLNADTFTSRLHENLERSVERQLPSFQINASYSEEFLEQIAIFKSNNKESGNRVEDTQPQKESYWKRWLPKFFSKKLRID